MELRRLQRISMLGGIKERGAVKWSEILQSQEHPSLRFQMNLLPQKSAFPPLGRWIGSLKLSSFNHSAQCHVSVFESHRQNSFQLIFLMGGQRRSRRAAAHATGRWEVPLSKISLVRQREDTGGWTWCVCWGRGWVTGGELQQSTEVAPTWTGSLGRC